MARHGPNKPVCGAQRPNQAPGVLCQNVAGERTTHLGFGRCYLHGGSTTTHIKAAAVEMIEREAALGILGMGEIDPVVDPYSALALLGGEVMTLKDILRGKVEELTTLKDVGGDKVATQIDVLMSAYERGLDRCERILTNMARLDLDGKIAALQARVDEQTSMIVSSALTSALNAATVDTGMREVILREFGAALRTPAIGAPASA